MIVSNAALQWVPDHRGLLPGLLGRAHRDGWLAFQVPGNFGAAEPHACSATSPADPRVTPHLTAASPGADADPAETYLDDLAGLGCSGRGVGDDLPARARRARTRCSAGSPAPAPGRCSLRLPDPVRAEFEGEYQGRLREAYPARPYGTVLPFRRIFVVAHKEARR